MPFPHVERAVTVRRPALVAAVCDTGGVGRLLWTIMITNARRPAWAGDVDIPDAQTLGLLIPSKVRTAKIMTVEEAAAVRIGRLDEETWRRVRSTMAAILGEG